MSCLLIASEPAKDPDVVSSVALSEPSLLRWKVDGTVGKAIVAAEQRGMLIVTIRLRR